MDDDEPWWHTPRRWPWRLSLRCFKRDPGGPGVPDLVWLHREPDDGSWSLCYEPGEELGFAETVRGFPSPTEAMDYADRRWPVEAVN